MNIKRVLKIKNEEDTRRFGNELARQATPGQTIGLIGDLGTGKTTITKYIAEGLGIKATVSSPTFTIVREYDEGRLPLYHFDIYRIGDPEELFDIGAEEYFYGQGLCVVEWADLAPEAMPEDTLYVFLEYGEAEGERIYKCTF